MLPDKHSASSGAKLLPKRQGRRASSAFARASAGAGPFAVPRRLGDTSTKGSLHVPHCPSTESPASSVTVSSKAAFGTVPLVPICGGGSKGSSNALPRASPCIVSVRPADETAIPDEGEGEGVEAECAVGHTHVPQRQTVGPQQVMVPTHFGFWLM